MMSREYAFKIITAQPAFSQSAAASIRSVQVGMRGGEVAGVWRLKPDAVSSCIRVCGILCNCSPPRCLRLGIARNVKKSPRQRARRPSRPDADDGGRKSATRGPLGSQGGLVEDVARRGCRGRFRAAEERRIMHSARPPCAPRPNPPTQPGGAPKRRTAISSSRCLRPDGKGAAL